MHRNVTSKRRISSSRRRSAVIAVRVRVDGKESCVLGAKFIPSHRETYEARSTPVSGCAHGISIRFLSSNRAITRARARARVCGALAQFYSNNLHAATVSALRPLECSSGYQRYYPTSACLRTHQSHACSRSSDSFDPRAGSEPGVASDQRA